MTKSYQVDANSVPVINMKEIEKEAFNLLKKFAPEHLESDVPVDIENLVNKIPGVTYYSHALTKDRKRLGLVAFSDGDVTIFSAELDRDIKRRFERGSIIIDTRISKVRKRFSIAHEIGHWVLHQNIYSSSEKNKNEAAIIACRDTDIKPIFEQPNRLRKPHDQFRFWTEWQANYFAGCLLMPYKVFVRCAQGFKEPFLELEMDKYDGPPWQEFAMKPLSRVFQVSKKATQLRLKHTMDIN